MSRYATMFEALSRRDEIAFGAFLMLGDPSPEACLAAILRDLRDPIEHQHGRQWQLCIARAKQFAPAAGQEVLIIIARLRIVHSAPRSQSAPEGRFGRSYHMEITGPSPVSDM